MLHPMPTDCRHRRNEANAFRGPSFSPFHEPGRNRSLSTCRLLMHMHQKLVIGLHRFMASMRSQKLEGGPFHEPRSRNIAELANSAMLFRGGFMAARREHPLVETIRQPALKGCCRHGAIQSRRMKPKALDCCRNYSFQDGCHSVDGRRKLRKLSEQSGAFGFMIGGHCGHRVHGPDAPTPSWWHSPRVGPQDV